MKIGMILAGHDFPPDVRVEKEARALRAGGHQVVILCDRLQKDRPLRSEWEGCEIVRVPSQLIFLRKVNVLIHLLTFQHPYWERAIRVLIERDQIDVLHVHDLPMLATAQRVARRFKLPVVADFHENYPAALKYYSEGVRWRSLPLLRRFHRPSRWEAHERLTATAADHIIVVVDEAKARLAARGIPLEKITAIENTEEIERFSGIPLDQELISRFEEEFVLTYIGGFGGQHRGLPTVVEAMPLILQEIPNARLLLVGHGTIKPLLEEMAAAESLQDRVTFIDWQPFGMIPTYIALSTVCLVPHESNPHTEATSPHKLFQYMLMGKPVVVSSCRPLQRLVNETGAGLVFNAGDSHSLARAIIKLKDEATRRRLGEAGRKAVLGKYNWQKVSQKLLQVYAELDRRQVKESKK